MKTSQIKKGDIVTADFGNSKASNTFIFEGLYGEGDQKTVALLKHPLAPKIIFPYKTEELNQDSVRIKDSTERSLDYVLRHQTRLDYNALSDLEALCLYFRQFKFIFMSSESISDRFSTLRLPESILVHLRYFLISKSLNPFVHYKLNLLVRIY